MADFFIYRINGGEILTISTESHAAQLGSLLAEVQDPSTPDGKDLAVKKIWDGTQVRNATAPEIANFQVVRNRDLVDQNRSLSENSYNDGNASGIVTKALALLTLDEINNLRQWIAAFKTEVAAATNLANLQSRVAALPNMPDRTKTQLVNAIKAKITSGAAD